VPKVTLTGSSEVQLTTGFFSPIQNFLARSLDAPGWQVHKTNTFVHKHEDQAAD
jgi:hypothetical protein